MQTTRRSSTSAPIIVGRVAIGAALIAPLQLRWLTRGNGSTFSGLRLASTLLHNDAVGLWGRLGGGAIFAIAFVGALSIATAPFGQRIVHLTDVLVGAAIVGTIVVLAVFGHPRISVWGAGLIVAGAAGLAAMVLGAVCLERNPGGRA